MKEQKPNIGLQPRDFYKNLAYGLFIILAGGYLLIFAKVLFCPLAFAVLFMILLSPVCRFMENRMRFPRAVSSAIAVILLLAVLSIIIFILATQVNRIVQDWATFKQQLTQALQGTRDWISSTFNIKPDGDEGALGYIISLVANSKPQAIGATLLSVSSFLLFAVLFIFETFFLLLYRQKLVRFLVVVTDKSTSVDVKDILKNIQHTTHKYLIGLLIEMGIVTAACCTVFWLTGVKFPVLMGMLTGLFNIIPYAGIYTALAINLVVILATGTPAIAISAIITVVIVHTLDSNLLLPFVVGGQTRVNALAIILALTAGAIIWHIPGMFLSVPLLAIVKIICDRVEHLKPLGILLGNNKSGGG
ncbi:MAG TPA: AI-2E family transporter [Chitinophagaceae bacterium]|nr:AI-2E family transporter [Chitinophagaceae bacterium]